MRSNHVLLDVYSNSFLVPVLRLFYRNQGDRDRVSDDRVRDQYERAELRRGRPVQSLLFQHAYVAPPITLGSQEGAGSG